MRLKILKKVLHNLLVWPILLAPPLVMAGEACHWRCDAGQRCGELDQITKICHEIPNFSDRQQLYKEAEKIGFVGESLIKAFDKIGPMYACAEGYRQSNTYWTCKRPFGMTPCGTQHQTIILDLVPSSGEVDPK